jgi:hypothetical protein
VRLRPAVFLAAILALGMGCVADTRPDPETCAQPAVTLDARVTDAGLQPSSLDVCRDQVVTLRITAEREGVVHIHGYDEQAAELRPEEPVVFQFVADHSGQFRIELHTDEETEGVALGVFTVHEP